MSTRPAALASSGRTYAVTNLSSIDADTWTRLPFVLRILLENVLRKGGEDNSRGRNAILRWLEERTSEEEIPFYPGRVLMHDTTCVPALVDIAGMRAALAECGGDPAKLNPVLPVDVSVDHSVAVDFFGTAEALAGNMERELARNGERYRFMKWAAKALSNVRVHPPGTGIMHTLNLERLASVVNVSTQGAETWAIPDTLIGTDSHTPMINGVGVLAWGVGGLEAESVLFGMPVMLRVPDVIGVRFSGRLRDGVLATDLALTVTEILRRRDLAGSFVEFFGPGVSTLSAGERAVVSNMAPEYGASTGYFPIDDQTLRYLEMTGRSREQVQLVDDYAKQQGLWFNSEATPRYTDVINIDLDRVVQSLAGPSRPQDRISPKDAAQALPTARVTARPGPIPDNAIAIAAITSCTNTSDMRLTLAAGLLARKARAAGLKPPPWVKTSFAPGSPTAKRYLQRAGLLEDLEALGFSIVGYGCTTCIGNSGPLTEAMRWAIEQNDARPIAVLSGNRNFPGRVHAQIDSAFLASPPLVVAYALMGEMRGDISRDPIGRSPDGRMVHLAEIWPSGAEIDAAMARAMDANDYDGAYEAAERNAMWDAMPAPDTQLFPWDDASTYIRRPPFAALASISVLGMYKAAPLLVLGDDMTTDHISPAGQIPARSDTAEYLVAHGESREDLNVYAARRGNWEAMLRGAFTNRALKNFLGADIPPGCTIHAPSGEILPIWRAAERYRQEGIPLVIVAGERYGAGSSRDWAAKAPALLGARAVLAQSFERIHRTNLIGMGILPLRLPVGLSPATLKLQPGDEIEISALPGALRPRSAVSIHIHRGNGDNIRFEAIASVETQLEVQILREGGILSLLLRQNGATAG